MSDEKIGQHHRMAMGEDIGQGGKSSHHEGHSVGMSHGGHVHMHKHHPKGHHGGHKTVDSHFPSGHRGGHKTGA